MDFAVATMLAVDSRARYFVMGICFFCPNGHPLNVKAELAGRIGLCPKCRVKMRIPLQSTRALDEKDYHGQQTAEAVPDARRRENKSSNLRDDSQVSNQANDWGETSSLDSESPVNELILRATEKSSRNIREKRYDAEADFSNSDALLDDPDALWYVITHDNQRYGPAQGNVLRSWINERRVGPKTRILRSGWQSPLEAGQVFPEIVKIFEKDGAGEDLTRGAMESFDAASFVGRSSYSDARESLDELRKTQRRTVGALCFISFLTFVLLCAVGALIWILLRR